MDINLQHKEIPAFWDSDKGSCSEAPHGAAGQNPVERRASETPLIGEEHFSSSSLISENLEGLTEKVDTLGLQVTKKNCCGAAKKQAWKTRLTEAPTGDSGSGQPWSVPGGKPQTSQKPGTSGDHFGQGFTSTGLKSLESMGHLQGPGKRQQLAGGTPEDGQAKRPRAGNLVTPGPLGRASRWLLYVRIIRRAKSQERTLQTSSEQSASLWMSSLKRGSPPG